MYPLLRYKGYILTRGTLYKISYMEINFFLEKKIKKKPFDIFDGNQPYFSKKNRY
jgi:hypothetical protein